MNTKSVNSAAGVILAALTQNRTAAGIALALDSAQMLMAPETASELERLRTQVAMLQVEVEAPELCADCGHLEGAHSGGDVDCTASGARLLKCTCSFFIPRYSAAGLVVEPASVPVRSVSLEDPHDGPLAHQYRVSRDLPGLGGGS